VQPGAEQRRLPQPPETQEGLQRGFLGDILRVGFGAEEPSAKAQHAFVVPLQEQDEHPPLPGKRQAYRRLVVGIAARVAHTSMS
jgi:hypothetical protein